MALRVNLLVSKALYVHTVLTTTETLSVVSVCKAR